MNPLVLSVLHHCQSGTLFQQVLLTIDVQPTEPAEHVLSRRHQTKAEAARLLLPLFLLLLLLPVVTVLDEPAGAPHFPLHLSGVQLPSHPSHQPEVLREEPGDGPLWVGPTLVVAVALAAQIAVLHDSSVHLNIDSTRSKADSLERYKN